MLARWPTTEWNYWKRKKKWKRNEKYKLDKIRTVGIWNPDMFRFQIKFVCKWSRSRNLKSGSSIIWNEEKCPPFCQEPFEIQTKMSRFLMVQSSNGWTIAIALDPLKTRPCHHFKYDLQKVLTSNGRISDPHCCSKISGSCKPKVLKF